MTSWLLTMAGSFLAIGGAAIAFKGLTRREYARLLQGTVMGVVGALIMSGLAEEALTAVWRAVAGPDVTAVPDAGGPGRGEDLPDGVLWWVLAAVAAVALVSGVAALAARRRRKASARRAGETRRRARWEAIVEEHDDVREAYGAYVADVLAVLDRPALADVSVPQTVFFLKAMDTAADAARSDDPLLYREAVSMLKTAWGAADAHARKAGIRHLPEQERVTVARARGLLVQALAEGGNEHEKRLAYQKARRLLDDLDGVVTMPRQAAAVLETRHRLALAKPQTAR
ncbi:hypothetical protein ACFVUY_38100 [Kitasatospora sp. NPDC058063]|uniref:hypothetical protein n=1 Tax=unclassified Kitasatospora TaxID=2633591 RepID=UPI0036D85303